MILRSTILGSRLYHYARLMRFHRPIGILLLLWPTLWALWIASAGQPHGYVLLVFVAGVTLMRAAGCVINDYADRHVDPHVCRTMERPLATGKLPASEAVMLFVALCLIAFALVLTLDRLTIGLSVIAVLLAAGYPFTKRYTHWPQAVLGLAFAWGVPMAFAAETGRIPVITWWIYAAAVIWALVYDTFYAMVDRDDDLRIGVKSTAILFGRHDLAIVGGFQVAMVGVLAAVGVMAGLHWIYFAGLSIGAGLFAYHLYLARERDRAGCFAAFNHNHWFGLVVFAGIALDFWLAAK